jgi:hypothetical protein
VDYTENTLSPFNQRLSQSNGQRYALDIALTTELRLTTSEARRSVSFLEGDPTLPQEKGTPNEPYPFFTTLDARRLFCS